MKTKQAIEKEKEKQRKLKQLRHDLEEKLEEQLPAEGITDKIHVEVEQVDVNQEMAPEHAKGVIEALLFAASKPTSAQDIRKVMKFLSIKDINKLVAELKEDYQNSKKSFEIIEIAGGYEIVTRKEYAPWLCKVEMQKKKKQATQSALETLAILAYKQPLTRAEVEEIRGVDASGVLSNLIEKGFVKIVGKKEIPGRPFLYGTTEKFLEHFGLNSIKDLPSIEELQSIVDNSVKKEDLLGTQNVVDVPQDEEAEERKEEAKKQGAEAIAAVDAVLDEIEEKKKAAEAEEKARAEALAQSQAESESANAEDAVEEVSGEDAIEEVSAEDVAAADVNEAIDAAETEQQEDENAGEEKQNG